MVDAKDISIEAIKQLPSDTSIEDIMFEINLVANILTGIEDADNGRVTTTQDLLKEIEQWHK